MRTASDTRASQHLAFAMRTGSIRDIDALCAIDLGTAALFEQSGLTMDFPDDHEYSLHERARWLRCLAARSAVLAVDEAGVILGFAIMGELDGDPYLEQLSVRMDVMRRGIGTALLNAAIGIARHQGARALWLTTYAHLEWNRPFYEKKGFVLVPAGEYGDGLAREVDYQCRWLPRPEQRVVMRKPLGARSPCP